MEVQRQSSSTEKTKGYLHRAIWWMNACSIDPSTLSLWMLKVIWISVPHVKVFFIVHSSQLVWVETFSCWCSCVLSGVISECGFSAAFNSTFFLGSLATILFKFKSHSAFTCYGWYFTRTGIYQCVLLKCFCCLTEELKMVDLQMRFLSQHLLWVGKTKP